MGAFEQPFGPVRGEFEQKFSKNSNAQGAARGEMLKLRFDWYKSDVRLELCTLHFSCSFSGVDKTPKGTINETIFAFKIVRYNFS